MNTLRLLSLGAGVQSTTLALMAADGTLPGLDGAIFADTGWEPARVYDHLERLEGVLAEAGIPLYRVMRGNLREDVLDPHVHATIPAFTTNPAGEPGMIGRRCTGRYKVEPIERQVRLLLGAKTSPVVCRYCNGDGKRVAPWDPAGGLGRCSVCRGLGERQIVGRVPAGTHAEQWIGFSQDEVGRVGGGRFPPYITPRYPLLDLRMTRTDCERWLRGHGWPSVAKSACIGCPFHGDRHWRDVRDNHPDEWADALMFDEAIRQAPGLDSQRFLHESRRPLIVAPIDRVSRREWADRQGDIFDALADQRAELGDPDGCSPYGCRSGEPVAS